MKLRTTFFHGTSTGKRWTLAPYVMLTALRLWSQSPSETTPEFEVASIKRVDVIVTEGKATPRAQVRYSHPNPSEPLQGISGNRFVRPFASLTGLMVDAYNVRIDQIFGAPAWATFDGDLYEINARAAGPRSPTSAQFRQMLQALLADRFKLKVHSETRNVPVYELRIAKNGPRLKEVPVGKEFPRPMSQIAIRISGFLDLPVVDKTGLTGENYQFEWDLKEPTAELRQGKPTPSIFGLVQDQLGLKLERVNTPAKVFVIDSAEKPSEN